MVKKLAKSKTIIGIVTAAVGAAVQYAHSLLTPEVMAQYGVYIQMASALLQTTGLGAAVYGRMKAQGPITTDTAQDSNGITGA